MDDVRRFAYHLRWMKIYFALVLAAWALACVFLPPSQSQNWLVGKIFLLCGLVILGSIFVLGIFMDSEVEVDQDAVSCVILGWRWRTIRWIEVKHIRILNIWDFQRHKKIKMCCLYKTERPRPLFLKKGALCFQETISGAEELEQIVMSEARKRGIRVEDIRVMR